MEQQHWDALTGPRIEDYWIELLDGSDNPVGTLDGVTSCKVEQKAGALIKGGGNVTLDDRGQALDWGTLRLRPWVFVNELAWPLGVYLAASPKEQHDEAGKHWDVPLLDKLAVLDQDAVTDTYSVDEGAVVTDEILALIQSAGEYRVAVTPSASTLASAMVWAPGTTKLAIVNDLLASINYWSLWVDRTGQYRVEPYRAPRSRKVVATFEAGETAIHSDVWSREQDLAAVPNRMILRTSGSGDAEGLVAVADDTDPASPFSYPSRGRWVAEVREGIEATDQATLDALAVRYLRDAASPVAKIATSHASVPIDLNAAILFRPETGREILATVQGYSAELRVGEPISVDWREVP